MTVLVDALSVAEHVRELVAWIQTQAHMQCSVLVLPCPPAINYLGRPAPELGACAPSAPKRAFQAIFWWALLMVERRRLLSSQFKGRSDNLFSLQAMGVRGGVTVFEPLRGESADEHIQRVRSSLLANAPDVIVQCGSFARAKEFAACAQHGLLDVIYGNDPQFRGGPPGFWEVFYRADKTGFLIRQWLATAAHGNAPAKSKPTPKIKPTPTPKPQRSVLMEGYLPTQGFFLLNQATLVFQAARHLQIMLSKLATGAALPSPRQTSPFNGNVQLCPSPACLLAYAVGVAARGLAWRVKSATGVQEQWGVHYARTDWKTLILERSNRIPNPGGGYYADPFIHDTEQGRYCFVEEFRHAKNKGEIAVLRLDRSESGCEPVRLGVALEEPFHLSFPFLFEYEGSLYMCPESHGSGQIRIYRCEQFPLQWKLHSVAMDAVAAVDTMIFPAHGVWWLMSSLHPMGDTETYPELHIFSAPDPLCGQWVPHAQNPLVVDPEFARNGGLLRDGNKIYRVSQARSFKAYGAWATVSEIKSLSLDRYEEDRVSQLKPSFDSRATGLHHLQSNDDFTVWDQKQWERVR